MDPSTTLITFMLQTSPSVRTVQLIGSWDNFTKHYAMEKDSRRARGQWRGCYAFDNIIYDGDGSGSPMRKGGLKMGHTYWYYYKIDGDIEAYDTTLPSTTSCPILPGQPVNFLSIPVEQVPMRDRSASVGTYTEPMKTMNPDDKYETPRRPPPTPKLARLNTSTGYESYLRKRPSRSESPKSSRSPWSPRTFFGPKTPVSATPFSSSSRDRGRDGDANISYPVLISRTDEGRKCVSLQDMERNLTDSTTRQQLSKRRNPPSNLNFTALELDDDDDANFARRSIERQQRDSQLQPTILSPPPSHINNASIQPKHHEHAPTLRLLTATNIAEADAKSKPLPSLPDSEKETPLLASKSSFNSSLSPIPLRLNPPDHSTRILRTDIHIPATSSNWTPSSHFSMDSLDQVIQETSGESVIELLENSESDLFSSGMISPTDSQYSDGWASPSSSLAEYHDVDDRELADFSLVNSEAGGAICSDLQVAINELKAASPVRAEFQYNPMISEVSSRGFQGYSLPDPAEYGSEITLKREVTIVESDADADQLRTARATFGAPIAPIDDGNSGSMPGLLAELRYLGEAISN